MINMKLIILGMSLLLLPYTVLDKAENGSEFIARENKGKTKITRAAGFKGILKETYGIILYVGGLCKLPVLSVITPLAKAILCVK